MLSGKYLNNLLQFFRKHQLENIRFEFRDKQLSCLFLAILSNYLTLCIALKLLSGDVEINLGPKSSSRKCFAICHWNLNGTLAQSYTKVSLLTAYNFFHNFNVICVSETILNSKTAPNDLNLEIRGYNTFLDDHPSKSKRGDVCIFYKAKLPLKVVNISNLNQCINSKFTIANKICSYVHHHRSPSQTKDEFKIKSVFNIHQRFIK